MVSWCMIDLYQITSMLAQTSQALNQVSVFYWLLFFVLRSLSCHSTIHSLLLVAADTVRQLCSENEPHPSFIGCLPSQVHLATLLVPLQEILQVMGISKQMLLSCPILIRSNIFEWRPPRVVDMRQLQSNTAWALSLPRQSLPRLPSMVMSTTLLSQWTFT